MIYDEKELIRESRAPFLGWFTLFWFVFALGVLSTPFVWIWHSFEMALKTGLTGLIGIIIVSIAWKLISSKIDESAKELYQELKEAEAKNPLKKVSKFQQRLDEAMERSKQAKAREN